MPAVRGVVTVTVTTADVGVNVNALSRRGLGVEKRVTKLVVVLQRGDAACRNGVSYQYKVRFACAESREHK
jgi:hypothetical protein